MANRPTKRLHYGDVVRSKRVANAKLKMMKFDIVPLETEGR